ncbi:MAG: YpdA family putative bacillithiol disulfide reductase [Melioribacteraceae bacterium]|nr:YpdA family putative bacillithiol disulfide reductase [Melioribacteraceae bacterium]MCF8353552.1 YpdA family putative bacillithiol disulfide reductase [Melioribacteraceae bacterium]MCF8392514.1 YpdA family putative bacillithiol disulfide reductase [Melioribacteraceae bacterium]MCF8418471.1 YpdA family putative bacillithiol disulfide reductase [Melioribacteraceae bacterium]
MGNQFDVIIIGAGPIGLACGIEAKRKNLKYLIIEKGCLVNSIYNYPTNMVFFSTSERLEIGDVPFISHGMKPTRTEALEYYRRAKTSQNLKINLFEKVNGVIGSKNEFEVKTEKGNYFTRFVIIATGFYDFENKMNIPGEYLPKVFHYYKEPHPYSEQSIVVVGGGNSAVDVALETFRRGADVTMVIRKNKIEDNVKYWVRPDIENRIDEGSIKAYFNSELIEIREKEVDVETPDGVLTIENDFVFAMTGYHPDFNFLTSIGIQLSRDSKKEPSYNPETFETNVPGIYIAGVVSGGMDTGKWFIENSRFHAENIISDIVNKSSH